MAFIFFLTHDYWLMIFIEGILCITILVSSMANDY